MKRLILVDGNSLMYRAYFAMAAMGNMKANSKGLYTSAVYSFVRMMNHLTNSEYDNILVAFDKGKHTFRHDIISTYKDGRAKMPDEMRMQIAYIKDYLKKANIALYELDNYEADDIIGTMAKMGCDEGYHVDIYSSDRDLLQLINENSIVHITKKGMTDLEDYTISHFEEVYGIKVNEFIDLKALMGDKSDNLTGVPGVGEKTGIKLLNEYHSVENIIANASNIKGSLGEKISTYQNDAITCKKMVTILKDAPIEIRLEDTIKKEPDLKELKELYEYLELNSLLKDLALAKTKEYPSHTEYKYIDNPVDIKNILVPYSSIVLETNESNYHKANLLALGIKNHLGCFIIDLRLLNESLDLQLFLSDKENHKSIYDYKKCLVLLKRLGITLDGVDYDMLLATYILNPTVAQNEFKNIALYHGYTDLYFEEEIYGKGAKLHLPEAKVLFEHVAKKANAIYILKKAILEKITASSQLSLLNDIEIPLSKVLAKMEFNGIRVDLEELNRQGEDLKTRIKTIEDNIYKLANHEFNISSPKQLGVVLFEELNLDANKKTKTGYSTNNEVLENLYDAHPIIPFIMEYRSLTKLYGTYIEGIRNVIYPDSCVHTIYLQTKTETGRLSSIEPNLQNIPIRTDEGKNIRKMFVPINKENTLFSADYSQIEIRVLADMANVAHLKEAINNDLDIHSETARHIFHKDDITDLDRRKAKAVNFGIIYGISAFGLGRDVHISNKEAKDYIEAYYEAYPEIKVFMDKQIEDAINNGYVKTIKNRVRMIPDINSKNYMLREFAKRTAMNAPIQGSAADIIKMAMVKIDKDLEFNHLQSKMLLQIHDELVFEVLPNEREKFLSIVLDGMRHAIKLSVPLDVSYSFGDNLDEVK